jgi:hypothetical protein
VHHLRHPLTPPSPGVHVSKYVIHIEASRSWWDGSSTTYCDLKITKVKVSGRSLTVTCPACKAIKKDLKGDR